MEQNPITPPMANSSNPVKPTSAPHTLIILLAILILALLASTGYLAFQNYQLKKLIGSPSTSPFPTSSPLTGSTADWAIYSGKTFTLRYPKDWHWKLKVYNENNIGFINHKEGELEPRNELSVNVYENANKLPAYDFIMQGKMGSNYGKSYWENNGLILSLVPTTDHPEYRAYKPIDWPSINGGDVRFLENSDMTKIARINIGPPEQGDENLFYQILSTFKFSQNESIDLKTIELPNGDIKITNTFAKFEIVVPVTYNLSGNGNKFSVSFNGPDNKESGSPGDSSSMLFTIENLEGKTLLEKTREDYKEIKENKGESVNFSEISSISFNGHAGHYFKCPFLFDQTCTYLPLKNGMYLTVLSYAVDKNNRGYANEINSIFSSFRFTN